MAASSCSGGGTLHRDFDGGLRANDYISTSGFDLLDNVRTGYGLPGKKQRLQDLACLDWSHVPFQFSAYHHCFLNR